MTLMVAVIAGDGGGGGGGGCGDGSGDGCGGCGDSCGSCGCGCGISGYSSGWLRKKRIFFLHPTYSSNGPNRDRDSYKAPIASYESLEFFKNLFGGRSFHREA